MWSSGNACWLSTTIHASGSCSSGRLERQSLVVDQASDGREALALVGENHYAVIVLDLFMPVLDGFGVLDAFGPARRVFTTCSWC